MNASIVRREKTKPSIPKRVLSGKVLPSHLAQLLATMVAQNVAAYEPPKQTRAVLLFWRQPEEWAEVLYNWVTCPHTVQALFLMPSLGDGNRATQHHIDFLRYYGSPN